MTNFISRFFTFSILGLFFLNGTALAQSGEGKLPEGFAPLYEAIDGQVAAIVSDKGDEVMEFQVNCALRNERGLCVAYQCTPDAESDCRQFLDNCASFGDEGLTIGDSSSAVCVIAW